MPFHRNSLQDPALNICEPVAGYLATTATEERGPAAGWMPQVEVFAVPYAIRIPVPAGDVTCPRCGQRFQAAGPTGYAGDQPICDLCLFEGSQPLGMLLALAAVVRAFGALDSGAGEKYLQASEELAAFARIYEIVAAKSGPARPFRIPDLEY